ncbi:hypothetical protein ACSBR1_016803 [Camellia fascicularis]
MWLVEIISEKIKARFCEHAINDVALAITQAGLSWYLNRRYGEMNEVDERATERKNNLPKNIRFRSTLLINIRPSTGIRACASFSFITF